MSTNLRDVFGDAYSAGGSTDLFFNFRKYREILEDMAILIYTHRRNSFKQSKKRNPEINEA